MALFSCLLAVAARGAAAERSVYFYQAQKVSDAAWLRQVSKWQSEGIERLIVSLEAGPEFLLEDPLQAQRLAGLFSVAVRAGIHIEGMILQDPSWALDPKEARARLRKVLEFEERYKGLIDAVQIDVEVYTAPQMFGPGEAWGRFGILVSALRDELKGRRSAVRLNAALPWWLAYGVSPSELNTIIEYLDGMALMVYADPGETPVANDLETFQRKVQPAVDALSRNGALLRVGIATYEQPSQAALAEFAQQLDELLKTTPGFRGVSYFHETAPFLLTSATAGP